MADFNDALKVLTTPTEWVPLDVRYPDHFPGATRRWYDIAGQWMKRALKAEAELAARRGIDL